MGKIDKKDSTETIFIKTVKKLHGFLSSSYNFFKEENV